MSLAVLALQAVVQWTWVWLVGRPGFPPALMLAEVLAQLAMVTACLAASLLSPGGSDAASVW